MAAETGCKLPAVEGGGERGAVDPEEEVEEEMPLVAAGEYAGLIWMWIRGEAGCEGMVIYSTLSKIARAARTLSWRVSKMDGVLRKMLIPSEALTASRAGIAAEKTNEGPLIRCYNYKR